MMCQYTAVATVVNQAFGDGGSSAEPERVDLSKAPSFDMALANINAALSFG